MQRSENMYFDNACDRHNDSRSHVVHEVSQQMNFQCARNSSCVKGVHLAHLGVRRIHLTHLLQLDHLPVLGD